jgi:hypothetical protein
MFSYVFAEERVPQDQQLRAIRTFVDEILRVMTSGWMERLTRPRLSE